MLPVVSPIAFSSVQSKEEKEKELSFLLGSKPTTHSHGKDKRGGKGKRRNDCLHSNSSLTPPKSPSPPFSNHENKLKKSLDSDPRIREYDNRLLYINLEEFFPSAQNEKEEEKYTQRLSVLKNVIDSLLLSLPPFHSKNGKDPFPSEPEEKENKKLNRSYALNLGLDKDGNVCPWAYLYLHDIRISNMILGKNADGTERVSYIRSFYQKPSKEFTTLEREYHEVHYEKWDFKKFEAFCNKYPTLSWADQMDIGDAIEGYIRLKVDVANKLPALLTFPYPIEGGYYYKAFGTCRTNAVRIKVISGSISPPEILKLFSGIQPITDLYPLIKSIDGVYWVILDPLNHAAGDFIRTVFGRCRHGNCYFTINHPSDREYMEHFSE